jgi:hypothetical protein
MLQANVTPTKTSLTNFNLSLQMHTTHLLLLHPLTPDGVLEKVPLYAKIVDVLVLLVLILATCTDV